MSVVHELRQRVGEFRQDPSGFAADVGREMSTQVSTGFSEADGAYIYPFQGILYFIRNPDLYRPIVGTMGRAALTSAAITIALLIFTWLPQMTVLSLFLTPFLGVPVAIVLVLIESWMISSLAVRTFYLDPMQDDLFERTLKKEGQQALVSSQPRKKVGIAKAVQRTVDRFSPSAIAHYLLTLPLNFIPVVGSIVFFIMNGKKMGQSLHSRYFELKGWNSEQARNFVNEKKGGYVAFGAIAFALQLLPVIGIFFSATSVVGAALWAVDLERHGAGRTGSSSHQSGQSTLR
ncbi:hypothetical protein DFS34DRAFT_646727 [Phlyctochytrium arcticum]|nr:hypothetical protein DFS34DRAFT_646727 [Phlyctochytrium arcticum]